MGAGGSSGFAPGAGEEPIGPPAAGGAGGGNRCASSALLLGAGGGRVWGGAARRFTGVAFFALNGRLGIEAAPVVFDGGPAMGTRAGNRCLVRYALTASRTENHLLFSLAGH